MLQNNKGIIAVVAVVIAIIVGVFLFSGEQAPSFGSSVNGGNVTDYDAVNTLAGYWVNSTQAINGVAQFVGSIYAPSSSSTVGTFTQGGGVLATTSIGAGTLTAANLASASLIEQTNTAAVTITLPASSTLTGVVPTAGQFRTIFFKNLGTAAVTLADGTGTTIKVASSTSLLGATGLKVIQVGGIGSLNFVRKSNTDIEVLLTPAL